MPGDVVVLQEVVLDGNICFLLFEELVDSVQVIFGSNFLSLYM